MFKDTPAFCSLSASDIGAMKSFYQETLGVSVKEVPEGLELHLAGGGMPVFVYPSPTHKAPENTVLNFMTTDIDVTIDELIAKGVSMEQYPDFHTDEKGISRNDGAHPGPRAMAWFKDPAGHVIGVMQE